MDRTSRPLRIHAPHPRCSRRATRSLRSLAGLVAIAAGATAQADTYLVTNTNDGGPGSFRQALLDANAKQVTNGGACAPHVIQFAIPGTPPHTIRPTSPLPILRIPMTIDAYTQPGSAPNSLEVGFNAIPGVELDGSLTTGDAFRVGGFVPGSGFCSGAGSIISGFAINRWGGAAIATDIEVCPAGSTCSAGGLRIRGNYIGTDVAGNVALGNGTTAGRAALVFGSWTQFNIVGDLNITAGGPIDPSRGNRNLISGNAGDAISIYASSPQAASAAHVIRNNYIGTNAAGTALLPNGDHALSALANSSGILVEDNVIAGHDGDALRFVESRQGTATRNAIGHGTDGGALGNGGHGVAFYGTATGTVSGRSRWTPIGQASIRHNAGAGVWVDGDALVDVIAVGIASNGGLGVDLAPAGVTPNDALDADVGPNRGLNAPVIASAALQPNNAVLVTGSYAGIPNTRHEIYFHFGTACDPSGSGEGEDPTPQVQFVAVNTDASGNATFSHTTTVGLPAGKVVTALARRFETVDFVPSLVVSEFSACRAIATPLIFSNGFE